MRRGLLVLPLLTACGAPQQGVPDGALVGGANAHLFTQPSAQAAPAPGARMGCAAGAHRVKMPNGQVTCAHTPAATVRTTTSALDKSLVDEMARETVRTGQPVAYTDGTVTVTTYGKP